MNHIKRWIIIACFDWKNQIRQRYVLVLSGLFFLIVWFSINQQLLPIMSAHSLAKDTAEALGLFGCLFVAVFGAMGFLREFQQNYDFLWTKTFTTADYIMGKYLGAFATILIALLPAGIWVGYLEYSLHGFSSLVTLLKIWGGVIIPTFLSILVITILVGTVFRSLLGTSLFMVLNIGGLLALSLDLTHLGGFAPYGIYISALISYGPDSKLLVLHRTFYLVLSVLVLLLSWLVMRFSPRHQLEVARKKYILAGTMIIIMLSSIFLTGVEFQSESNRITTPLAEHSQTNCENWNLINSHRVEILLNRSTGQIKGQTYLELRLPPESTKINLPIALNNGMHVTQVSASQDVNAEISNNNKIFSISFPPEIKGNTIFVAIEYKGTISIPRYLYDNKTRLDSLRANIQPYSPGGYVSGRATFLIRDGNWRPFSKCSVNSLTLTMEGIKSNELIVHTADSASFSDTKVVLNWQSPVPLALFALSQNYRTVQITEKAHLIMPDDGIPNKEVNRLFSIYPALMHQIERVSGTESSNSPSQIVIVPLIKYGAYDPDSGTLFLPERDTLLLQYQYRMFQYQESGWATELTEPDALYARWTSERMMRLWWSSNDFDSSIQVYGYGISAIQSHYQITDSAPDTKPVLNALLSYSALRLVEPIVGSTYVREEMATRSKLANDDWTPIDLPMSLFPNVNSLMVRFDNFWLQYGEDSFWRLVKEYRAAFGSTSISLKDFEFFVKEITGVDLP